MVKKLTHSDDDVKRYVGAVTEHYTDGLKAIGEQYADIRRDIRGLKNNVEEKFKQVDQKLDSHTEMIGNIMVDVETLKGDMKVVKKDMEIMKSDIQIIKSDVKKKVDYEEFTKLERWVAALEARGANRQ